MQKIAILYNSPSAVSIVDIYSSLKGMFIPIFYYKKLSVIDQQQLELLSEKVTFIRVNDFKLFNLKKESQVLCGVVTFSDSLIQSAAELSDELNFVGHSKKATKAVTNKLYQRQLLNGMNQGMNYRKIDSIKQIDNTDIVYPVVAKPLSGSGGDFVTKIINVKQLKSYYQKINKEILIEEFMIGKTNKKYPWVGDYISVELVHSFGKIIPITVTGKFRLSERLRETGMFVPALFLSDQASKNIVELAMNATRRLNIENGISHTEIKLTNNGPKIIEVNGRLGGTVYSLVKKAYGINLIQIAAKVAVGEKIEINKRKGSKIFFKKFLLNNDNSLVRFDEILEKTNDLSEKGMIVEHLKKRGEILNPTLGFNNRLAIILGRADSMRDLKEKCELIDKSLLFIRSEVN